MKTHIIPRMIKQCLQLQHEAANLKASEEEKTEKVKQLQQLLKNERKRIEEFERIIES